LTSGAAAQIPITVKAAAGQTADLVELKDSTNAVLASFDNLGRWTMGRFQVRTTDGWQNGAAYATIPGQYYIRLCVIDGYNNDIGMEPAAVPRIVSGNLSSGGGTIFGGINFTSLNGNGIFAQLTPAGGAAFGGPGSFGGGTGPMLFLGNDTADPSTNPAGGGILYVSAGALKYRGSSGTVTTLAPA
jgi:hypothetical protein